MSPLSDDDKVLCYLSSNSLSDDNEVTRLHSQRPKGEEEDDDTDNATDGGRRAVHIGSNIYTHAQCFLYFTYGNIYGFNPIIESKYKTVKPKTDM